MSRKKNFGKGISAILGEDIIESNNSNFEPLNQTPNKIDGPVKKQPTQEEKRATFIVKTDHIENLKAIAFWERKNIKEILQDALENYFQTVSEKGEGNYLEEAKASYEKSIK